GLARRRALRRGGLESASAGTIVRITGNVAAACRGIVVRIESAVGRAGLRAPRLGQPRWTRMSGGLGNRQVVQVQLLQALRADVATVHAGLQLPFPDRVAAL